MNHTIPQEFQISKQNRVQLAKHNPLLIWFTGLSGSGKSTIANALEINLFKKGVRTYILDGDNTRQGINKDLGFSEADRTENIRRVGEIANLMLDAGIVVLASFVSPFNKDRKKVKQLVGDSNFVEIFVSAPLEVCEKRDVKGLYKKARAGEIKNMTGISSPFEIPENANLTLQTDQLSIEECVHQIQSLIEHKLKL